VDVRQIDVNSLPGLESVQGESARRNVGAGAGRCAGMGAGMATGLLGSIEASGAGYDDGVVAVMVYVYDVMPPDAPMN